MENDLGVGRGAVVVVAEPAADAEDTAGESGFAEEPAGEVHLVDALVADVAVAGGPDPVPIVVEVFAAERVFWGRTTPDIVIDGGRDGLGAGGLADARAAFVAKAASEDDFTEVTILKPLTGLLDAGVGADLDAGLDDAVIFAGGLDELATFPDVVGDGFLDVNIFAGLDGPDGGEGIS